MIRWSASGVPYRIVCGVRVPVTLYFAYGMNLDPRYMPVGCEPIGAGTLHDWRFDFRRYADVQPQPGQQVPGAVWVLTGDALDQLDSREGYPALYDRKPVPVQLRDGSTVQAIVYTMTQRSLAYGLAPPSGNYLEMIEHGYEVFGLDLQLLVDALRRCGAPHMDAL